MNRLKGAIGLARKAGALAVGTELVRTAVRSKKAAVVLLASDASPNAVKRAEGLSAHYRVPLLRLPLTMAELGAAAGRPPAAMAGAGASFRTMIEKAIPAVQPENGP